MDWSEGKRFRKLPPHKYGKFDGFRQRIFLKPNLICFFVLFKDGNGHGHGHVIYMFSLNVCFSITLPKKCFEKGIFGRSLPELKYLRRGGSGKSSWIDGDGTSLAWLKLGVPKNGWFIMENG